MKTSEALSIKEEKRVSAIAEADKKRKELQRLFPRIAVIDKAIESVPFRILGGESPEKVRNETEQLNIERANLLTAAGYAPDYDEPVFECKLCDDSGYVDGLKLCKCIKAMVSNSNYAESKLAKGLLGKSFDNFSLSYYKEENGQRDQMQALLSDCKRYAESFPDDNAAGLLFWGGTGLGKTHLSAAIANTVAGKGLSVVFESAQQIFDTCDSVRFNRLDVSERTKYETCSLLVIDDLGAEVLTPYSVSYITSLIDLRINNGKKTIINTNLASAAIRKNYGERLISRLLGEFRVLRFIGTDIRMQKIKNQ